MFLLEQEKDIRAEARMPGANMRATDEMRRLDLIIERGVKDQERLKTKLATFDIQKKVTEKKVEKFCKLIETNHYDFFVIVGKKLGLDVTKEEILKWVGDMDPVLFYLKDKFNRPRPYQLAKELNLPLYPITASDANSAAYPSGHTLDFLVILYHFGKMKPEIADEVDDFYHQIKRVRELSGLHYPSDRKVSEYLFKQLVKNKLIK